jgi:hypothetical protein
MEGSSLFQALMAQTGGPGAGMEPDYDAGPLGHGMLQDEGQEQGGEMGLEELLAILALVRSGVNPEEAMAGGQLGGQPPMGPPGMGGPPMGGPPRRGLNPSGLQNDPMAPGQTMGLQNPNVIM